MINGYIVFSSFLLIRFFKIFHNLLMVYNTRNWSNDTTESQKEEKTCVNAHFKYSQSNITGLNKMLPLTSLAMLKCESRTSLHAVQYKWQACSVLMFRFYYFKYGYPRRFVHMSPGTASLTLFLACSQIFCQNQGFCSYKIVLIKKKSLAQHDVFSWRRFNFL